MKNIFALLVVTMIAFAAQAQEPFQGKVTLQFEVNTIKKDGGSYGRAVATDVLSIRGDRYQIDSETVAFGFITLLKRASRGGVGALGLMPEEFRDQRKTKAPAVATIDRVRNVVSLEFGENRQEALREPLYDQLSFAYGFTVRAPDAAEYHFYMTDGKRVSEYLYRKIGTEVIDSPMGKLETLHLKKVQDKDDERGADLWLASAHHYFPVKAIVTEKDGGRLEQVVSKITY